MPITFYFRPEAKLVICVHAETVSDDEFLASYKALLKNDLFDTSMNLLIDLRQADSTPRSQDVLHQLAKFVQGQFTDTSAYPKVAVVAPKDISFGLARMYEAFSDDVPWEFVVYRAADAALAWLGVPEDFMDDLNKDAQQ